MNQRQLILAASLLLVSLALSGCSCVESYTNPPQSLQKLDYEGIWETSYGRNRVDRIEIKENGTFKQIYQDYEQEYKFETPWNTWWLEYFPDGRVYIHLEGGRFYAAGVRVAELDGMEDPCSDQNPECGWDKFSRAFWDPYTGKAVKMPGELLLVVRVNTSGELIFHHMKLSPDEGGFAIIGGESYIFHRIER